LLAFDLEIRKQGKIDKGNRNEKIRRRGEKSEQELKQKARRERRKGSNIYLYYLL